MIPDVYTIQQYENTFTSKRECATYFKVSFEQLSRYKKMKALVIDDNVYVPAIKRAVTLERLAKRGHTDAS